MSTTARGDDRHREIPVTQELAETLRIFRRSGTAPVPDVPEPQAAVVLVRDSSRGLQVFVTRTVDALGHAERGRYGFPTGTVDPSEIRRLPIAGWDAARCARQLRIDSPGRGLSWFSAAARTVLRKLGVFLAQDAEGRVVGEDTVAERARDGLDEGRRLAEVVASRDHALRPDLLRPWLRWVNTPLQLRRFDTVYFLAAVPQGQSVRLESTNEVWGGWMRPEDVLELGGDNDSDLISPPTRILLESFAGVPTVGSTMTRIRDILPVTPEIVRKGGDWWVSFDRPTDPSERGQARAFDVLESTPEEENTALVDDEEVAARPDDEQGSTP
ncbi:hypothetical protein [Brevibacterium litoralis]|uniref:hypothetical protein n=1 Tax=Brevibacterium litoralis TaxID=3138935 RepID=UPI0032F00E01